MITFVPATGSTNADLATRVAAGERLPDGVWLVANRQTGGRGRQGRVWLDGAGNFMGSTVVTARAGDPPLQTLALVAGLALHTVISPLLPPAMEARLKWPNDVMIGPAKLAGVLLERIGDCVVIGLGVNLAAAPAVAGRETAALAEFGPAPDRDGFAHALAAAFGADLDRWRATGLGPIISRWIAAAHPVGTPLIVGDPHEETLAGTFAGLDNTGALILRLPGGATRTIHAGEVRLGPWQDTEPC